MTRLKRGWRVTVIVTCSVCFLFACDSDWERREYCSDLGRRIANKMDADDEKSIKETNGLYVSAAKARKWTYCASADRCLMQVRTMSYSATGDNARVISETLAVRDAMTDEALIVLSVKDRLLNGDEESAFEARREQEFPACFGGDPIKVGK